MNKSSNDAETGKISCNEMNGLKRHRLYFRISVLIAALILAVFLVQMHGKMSRQNGNDFVSYLWSSRALLRGDSPYQTGSVFPYIYPPFLAFILIPLSFLPLWLSGLLWFLLNAAAFIFLLKGLLNMLFKVWGTDFNRCLWPLVVGISLLTLDIIQNHFLNGQVNFIMLALIFLFFKKTSQGKEIAAAIFLSLAIAIKLVPLIFLVYLLFRSKFRTALSSFVLTAFFVVLPYSLVGNKIISFGREYFNYFILNRIGLSGELSAGHIEYSLQSLLKRVFLSVDRPFLILILSSVLVMMPIIYLEIKRFAKNDPAKELWMFCLYLIAILLISPMSEVHHLALFLPALALGSAALLFRVEYVSFGRLFLCVAVLLLLLAGELFDSGILYFLSLVGGYCWMITMGQVNS